MYKYCLKIIDKNLMMTMLEKDFEIETCCKNFQTTMSTFVLDMSTFGLVFMMVIAKGKQFYRKISTTGYLIFFYGRKSFLFIFWTTFFKNKVQSESP